MPFDFPIDTWLPENLNFEPVFEPTKVKDKKYVINGNTGDYIGVVGDTFNCASHADFFSGVHDTITECSDGLLLVFLLVSILEVCRSCTACRVI